jgi:hypothetical protein
MKRSLVGTKLRQPEVVAGSVPMPIRRTLPPHLLIRAALFDSSEPNPPRLGDVGVLLSHHGGKGDGLFPGAHT